MIVTMNGVLEVPTPSLDLMVQTIRASVYGKDSKLALEMKFRKSALYTALKGNYGKGKAEDAMLLFSLWKRNPGYLEACVEQMNSDNSVPLLPSESTLARSMDFCKTYFSERTEIYTANAHIVGGMIDGLGMPLAQATYFGSYFGAMIPRDILAAKNLGVSPEEIECAKENGVVLNDSLSILGRYAEIKKITGDIESVIFASHKGFPVDLCVAVIKSGMGYTKFMQLICDENYSAKYMAHILEYDIDPTLAQIIHNSAAVGYQQSRPSTMQMIAA